MEAIKYGIEERIIRPAPDLGPGDLVTQSQAREILGISQQAVLARVNRGSFTVVWHLGREGPRAGSARLLLRAEVEATAPGRRSRGMSYRVAPDVDASPAPSLDGVEYGIEQRVIRPAPHLADEDVIGQKQAAELLGIAANTLLDAMDRGRFTVVWDLERRNGTGATSARLLLRSEVEAGGRQMSRASYRMPPGSE